MAMFLLPYKPGSESARLIAEEMNIKRIRHENSKFKASPNKTVINWGMSKMLPHVEDCLILNRPNAVASAANKIEAFKLMEAQGVSVPDYTDDKDVARYWAEEGNEVVCRTLLNGHGGEGIVLASSPEEVVDAPLYTKYVKKRYEYRFHIAFDSMIDVQRKARSREVPDEEVNWKIRNMVNGFIFSRENLNYPNNLTYLAKRAVKSLGLHFGAVDIIYNEQQDMGYVLEVNTAPGLKGTTLGKYVDIFQQVRDGIIPIEQEEEVFFERNEVVEDPIDQPGTPIIDPNMQRFIAMMRNNDQWDEADF